MPIDESTALEFFERHQELAEAFDPRMADLYSDDAKITTLRLYLDGETRELSMSGKQFKEVLARQRLDLDKYSRDNCAL
ncbi:MAG: hypothetical protein ACREIA_25920 [Opitutaceae bacterium]